jgi:hypothetical protein
LTNKIESEVYFMSEKRQLEIMESIATVAQDSAEAGNLDQTLYADVFEYISGTLHSLISQMGGAAV